MTTPTHTPEAGNESALPDLHETLDEAATLLSELIDLERRDVMAPQRLLGAADLTIVKLSHWRSKIARQARADSDDSPLVARTN